MITAIEDIAPPVAVPVGEILATDGLPLLQVPPVVASVSTLETPMHKCVDPVMEVGKGFTVTTTVAGGQLEFIVYVTVAVPADTPVTTPVTESTEATEVLPLAHLPPIVPSDKAVFDPAHMLSVPVMAVADIITVVVVTAVHQPAFL